MVKLPESEFLMLLKVSMKPIGAEVCVVLKSHNILENIIFNYSVQLIFSQSS